MKHLLPTVFAATLAFSLLATSTRAASLYTLNAGSGGTTDSWAFGEIFTVTSPSNLSVTALGAFDWGSDGFSSAGGIPVGLYRESDKALLASTTVVSTDPLSGYFRFASITPVTLLSGQSYRVVAVSLNDEYNHGLNQHVFAPETSYVGSAYGLSTTLAVLDDTTTGTDGPARMANLQFDAVPEPCGVTLILGALSMAAMRRRR